MWYLYLMIVIAAACLAIPLFLVYWTDKKKQRAYDKRNRSSDDMTDLDHY